MERDGKKYLLIVDYFYKYLFLFQMSSTIINAVIGCLTELFALKVTPPKFSPTTGYPCNSKEWNTFTYNYGFRQTVSSPHDRQSNSFIKRNVQTMKNKLNKAKASKIRWTPLGTNLPSPIAIQHNRPAGPSSNTPPKTCKALIRHQQEYKRAHDNRKKAESLLDLYIGNDVL